MHWRRNCSADHTATQTIGHSTIDISVIRDTQRPWSFVQDLSRWNSRMMMMMMMIRHFLLNVGNLCEVRYYIKLLISKNRTLTLTLHHFVKRWVNVAKYDRLVKKTYMQNKTGKFDIKIFFCYENMAILVSGYFFLNRPCKRAGSAIFCLPKCCHTQSQAPPIPCHYSETHIFVSACTSSGHCWLTRSWQRTQQRHRQSKLTGNNRARSQSPSLRTDSIVAVVKTVAR